MDIKKNVNISKGIKVNTDPKRIDEILERGTVDVIVKEDIKKDLLSGRRLNIYYGIDPTGKEMHLGHASTQRKIRDFQELGHNITLLVGDYTVRVGDHSDQLKQREEITDSQIEENMKTFKKQYGKTVDISKVNIRYNSEWLKKLKFIDVINLAKIFTVQQMIEREAFAKRLEAKNPIGFDELLYPLMQGYDALSLKTDIQIEGTDQLFNMIAGRKIMEHFGMKPQGIITMPMLIGPDGREMHKSLGNYIAVTEKPNQMYGKIMSMKDEVMIDYYTLLTRIPMDEINELKASLKKGRANPMKAKKRLAFEITKFFNGEKQAVKAEKHFEKTVQKGEMPDEITMLDRKIFKGAKIPLLEMLKTILKKRKGDKGLPASTGEVKRLVKQGGVKVDGKKVTDLNQEIDIKKSPVITIGKRYHIKIGN